MLKPDENRLNYSKLLTPPDGYNVSFAVGTTYTLDLEALIGVPLSFGLSEELDQTIAENDIYLLEALRKSADHFMIFCEGGQIKVPKENNLLFSLMEDSVFEVSLENEKSFHPKIWLLKFENDSGDALYRLLVLSRNMTFDRSWDLTVALEGRTAPQHTTKNQPLMDFLSFLTRYSTNEDKTRQINHLMAELPYIEFNPMNKHIADFEFYPLGINSYDITSTELFDTFHKLIIISPFISKTIIQKFYNNTLTGSTHFQPERALITRKTELPKLSEKFLEKYDVYTLKDAIVDGESTISEEDDFNDTSELQDIHAKLYAKSKYNHHTIYIGSANSSYNAFNGNIEFLLKLHYRKRGFQINSILDDLFGEAEDNPFEQIQEMPEQKVEETDITEQLQQAVKILCKNESSASVIPHEDKYSIQITVPTLEMNDDIDVEIGPLLSKQMKNLQQTTMITSLNILELGHFYKVVASKENQMIERVIKIHTDGLPEDRSQAIYRSIISNSQKFLKYIAFLLADDYLMAALENAENQINQNTASDSIVNHPVIYENMLKTAYSAPEKLQDIEEMIRMIEDETIIPAEFNTLYQTFIQAIKKVKR